MGDTGKSGALSWAHRSRRSACCLDTVGCIGVTWSPRSGPCGLFCKDERYRTKMTQPYSVDQVRKFYDQFMSDQMLTYRVNGNLRIEKAIEFFDTYIRTDDVIIDVG